MHDDSTTAFGDLVACIQRSRLANVETTHLLILSRELLRQRAELQEESVALMEELATLGREFAEKAAEIR
jgi:hypothetical protein